VTLGSFSCETLLSCKFVFSSYSNALTKKEKRGTFFGEKPFCVAYESQERRCQEVGNTTLLRHLS